MSQFEILAFHGKEVFGRCTIVPYGTANVGQALGQMVDQGRFRRSTRVFLDGDNAAAPGCILLPGDNAPERVVFDGLRRVNWGDLWSRIARDISVIHDVCTNTMTLPDHHDWIAFAAKQLMCGSDSFWHAMCIEWAKRLPISEARPIVEAIEEALP